MTIELCAVILRSCTVRIYIIAMPHGTLLLVHGALHSIVVSPDELTVLFWLLSRI